MVVKILTLVFLFSVLVSLPSISSAQPWRHGMYDRYERRPYGQSCPSMRGDPYGARKQVRTMEEARQVLEQYLEGTGKKAAIGTIEERRWFFLVELLDANGTPIDKTIIDKRTGRIRSIY